MGFGSRMQEQAVMVTWENEVKLIFLSEDVLLFNELRNYKTIIDAEYKGTRVFFSLSFHIF